MAITHKLISNTVLSSSQASIVISSIPTTFDDLSIFCSMRSAGSNFYGSQVDLRFNSDSSNSYYSRYFLGGYDSGGSNNSRLTTYSSITGISSAWLPVATSTAFESSSYGVFSLYIAQYRTANWKPFLYRGSIIQGDTSSLDSKFYYGGGAWSNTSAVNSITLYLNNGQSLAAGSSVKVYGISKT